MWWSLTLSDCSSVNLCFQSINQVSKCKYILSYLNIQSTADSHLWATASRHSIWHHSHPFLVTRQTHFSIWTYRECLSEENPQSADILQQNKELLIRPVNDNTSLCLSICLSLHLSIYLSIYLSICLSVHPFVCLSICPYICLSVHPSVSLSICPSICLSFHPSVCLSLYLSVYLSIHLSVSPSVHLSICPSVSFHLSTFPSVYLSICLFVHPSVCLSICLSFHPRFFIIHHIHNHTGYSQ